MNHSIRQALSPASAGFYLRGMQKSYQKKIDQNLNNLRFVVPHPV